MQNVRKQKAIALSLDTQPAINRANSLLLASMVIAALALVPGVAHAQSGASSTSSTAASASSTAQTAAPEDSLAAAARKAKEAKSQNAKPAKVFTNDNLPTNGVISTVGAKPADNSATEASSTSAASPVQGEKYWRDKFASLNKKLEQDQSELDVMQRELGQLNLQNYGDPVQAMQQGLTRSDINEKTAAIDAKQKAVDADKQAIEDAEDDLRKSGGDAGWAR